MKRWSNTPDQNVLAVHAHNPATTANLSTTSVAYVDIDPNIAITFRAPSSGRVLVTCSLYLRSAAGGQAVKANVREGGADIPGTGQSLTDDSTSSRVQLEAVISSLVPGSQHSYTIGWRVSSGTGYLSVGGADTGPAVITVTALP